ncbi:MAG: ATP-dependent Clp protease adaptor ClpS [Bacteroidetes bacterium]|nr:MAG: ATP-dependent Clp protease adaptor ClpS [Bacteroidota bacterium]
MTSSSIFLADDGLALAAYGLFGESQQPDEEEVVLEDVDEDIGQEARLVVYNDDVNTFDWVIQCFVEILGHTVEQAEQLSLIIHFKGKATVKTDSFEVLRPLKNALVDRGLSAVIER